MKAYSTIRLDLKPPIATLVLDRPNRLNSINGTMWQELDAAVGELEHDDSVAVVIVTGAGRAFCAGADLVEMAPVPPAPLSAIRSSQRIQTIFRRIENLGIPTLAAVNGPAIGGGCELAIACTLRIASKSAIFSVPEIDLGVVPGTGATHRLSRLVGHGRALELLLTGEPIDATEAYRIGLANRLVPDEELDDSVWELAQVLAGKSRTALALTMLAANLADQTPADTNGWLASALFGLSLSSTDHAERRTRFLDRWKRQRTRSSEQG